MSRWLYNVNAVKTHFHGPQNSDIPPDSEGISGQQDIHWWGANTLNRNETNKLEEGSSFRVGEFVGQGRRIQYCGSVSAILEKAGQHNFGHDMNFYNSCATNVIERLRGPRPFHWYTTSAVAFFLVWSQVLMAFMIAYNTPTVGLGCWSGGYLLYGILSSVSWVLHLFSKSPGHWIQSGCQLANAIALCWLITFTILVVRLIFPLLSHSAH
jgi:hypothetical protein